ncbi:type IV conjugative transfer system coupling protein TraD [Uliginosibacterium gangwonense]|uniref:type IV conjugative transfer system coupling protein TraD n=1 Tax=Uliginosibacterium gangwonense TaxID=392736 RepID=UPI000363FD3E|nr:type IV conjugative transfer system coupling protein TraD [Uliginosibacterium gangwonense]
MSSLEALLRPPVELYSAATTACAGTIALTMPWALQCPTPVGLGIATAAFGFAYWRGKQGYEVLRYTMGLKKYKITSIAPHKIPNSRERLYLGDGFLWTQKHTQRLMDARSAAGQKFLEGGKLSTLTGKALRAMLKRLRRAAIATALVNALVVPRWWNPLSETPDLGGSTLLHGVEPKEIAVSLNQKLRSGHMLVIGTTRVGKTRLMELLVTQDIRDGKVVIVLDPKGDRDLMLRVYAEAARAGRLDQFYLFHLGFPEISARYNGIGNFARVTEIANRTTNALPASGNSAAFKEFSWRFVNLVAQAQVALGMVPTYQSILSDITNIEPLFVRYARHALSECGAPNWKFEVDKAIAELESKKQPSFTVEKSLQSREPEVIALIHVASTLKVPGAKLNGVQNPVLQGMCTAVRYDRTFFEKIIASLGPFLEKLITGDVGKMISPDYFDPTDQRPVFDWMQVIRQGGIVYVGLDALSDPVVSSAVGNSMLADLVSVGGKIYKTGIDPHNPNGDIVMADVALHADEVNELMGPEFIPMVNKLGGSGFKIHAYTQTIPDIEARLGDSAKAQQVLGNFNHVVMLRVKLPETAEFFCKQLPKAEVTTLMAVSGVSDTAGDEEGTHFKSNNQDRVNTQQVEMLTVADVMELPQGQAFALLEGNRLYKIRMPLPDSAANDPFVPASLREIGEKMRQRYEFGASENWAESANADWGDVVLSQPIGVEGDNNAVGQAA